MVAEAKEQESFGLNRIIRHVSLRTVIVIAPLLIIGAFCVGYIQMKSTSMQRALVASQAAQKIRAASQTNTPSLHLIVRPDIPQLDRSAAVTSPEPTPGSQPAPIAPDAVGPSSKYAGHLLQGVSHDSDLDQNKQLQATRSAVKLDDLHL